jgi:hypothetical protein
MTIKEHILMEIKKKIKQRLDNKCWDGYRKKGTKIKNGVRVNNCVPFSDPEDNGSGE